MTCRTEHPKPQFRRDHWENLNGPWEFLIDQGASGLEQGFQNTNVSYDRIIQVPFCPESKLSGIEYRDFMTSVWYRRSIRITAEQLRGRVFLHFGAVDYEAALFVNGQPWGTHRGGYASFQFDITQTLHPGENTLVLNARDDTRSRLIPSGKQSEQYQSFGCYYTRTTGIWQTVWLEFVPEKYIRQVRYTTNAEEGLLVITADLAGAGCFTAEALYGGRPMGTASCKTQGGHTVLTLPLAEKHLWEPGCGRLYDLELHFEQDRVHSYFGLRSLTLQDRKFCINGRSVFQRLVLDQGFYPEGIYTAPSDQALIDDIRNAMAMGFNGARLHEKVFEERFLYHCDRLGYLVWGEYPNWGLDHSYADCIYGILPEWLEVLHRDHNHPSIVGWCPFNETWDQKGRQQFDDAIRTVYLATKAADSSRPCIDTSGNFHTVTDIYDLHDYEQDPAVFAGHYARLAETGELADFSSAFSQRQQYDKKAPFFVSEYGGIAWDRDARGWGYGNAPKTPEEFLGRLKGLTDVLLDNEGIFGLCYTQLTDVEQEQNGLYTYDRVPKFPPETVREIFARKAAIED